MRDVPRFPWLLGWAALVPQLALLGVALFGPPEQFDMARSLALTYAALGLSFSGGAWWGIAAGAPAAERRSALGWLWIAALMPGLVALACLALRMLNLVVAEAALVMLGAAMLVSLAGDIRLAPLAPRWWLSLRVPLAIMFGAATILIALA